jgi:tetratricopeptide (TPR) repeat protein
MGLVLLVGSGLLGQSPELLQSPDLLLEEAFYKEVAALDPDGAIQGYEALLSNPASTPRDLAILHVRLGICYRLRGELQESKKHFEAVIQHSPGESEAVKIARRYLGQPAVDDPARFLPADVLFYVELVEPAEHIRALSELVQDTPFQNPVDYYVSHLALRSSDPPDFPPAPEQRSGDVSRAAAFLNEGFLREMQKIGALAAAVPGERAGKDELIAILLPGASDILRGLVQMTLTLSKAKASSSVREVPIFRLPPEHPEMQDDSCLHIGLGKDAILLGRPRGLVEDAIQRYASGGPSLADDPDFRRAQGGRSGSLLFSYLRRDRVLAALRESTPPKDIPVFDALRAELGLNQVHSLSFSLSRASTSDSLRLGFRGRLDGEGLELWRALSTQPLSRAVLRAVPSSSLLFLAARLDNGPGRVEALHRAARHFLELLPPEKTFEAREKLEGIHDFLTSPPARELLEALDEAVLGLGDEPGSVSPRPFYLVARFKEPDRGAQVFEEMITAFFGRFVRNSASREFQNETLRVQEQEMATRFLEPFPGTKLWCHRWEDLFALTPSAQLLFQIDEAFRSGKNASLEPLPPGASKVLFLRPAALIKDQPASREFPREVAILLSEVGRALLTSREGKDSFSLEWMVPEVTPTVRAMLRKLAALQAAREETKETKGTREKTGEKRSPGEE